MQAKKRPTKRGGMNQKEPKEQQKKYGKTQENYKTGLHLKKYP